MNAEETVILIQENIRSGNPEVAAKIIKESFTTSGLTISEVAMRLGYPSDQLRNFVEVYYESL